MSLRELNVGKLLSGRAFTLPVDYQVHTTALIGIRGSGKTVAATDLAEEMAENGLPFVCIDPVGVWWGLRCNPDGTPGGLPVVVIGGAHGDLPLEKDSGARIADAILEHDISCVIDMSSESKNTVRKFVTDFCDRLMELNPSGTRHIFLEEAPELVPQKPMGEQKRSLAAVDRLVRLGRNKGYGCTLISQRFATINKDVLTQCENLIALRCIGKHDRDAAAAWIAEVVHETESEKTAEKFIRSLTQLENGSAWFWSPQWLKEFIQVQFRRRKTLHPGETRTVGQSAKQVQLLDVGEFVSRFQKTLSRPKPEHSTDAKRYITAPHDVDYQKHLQEDLAKVKEDNVRLNQQLSRALGVIVEMRKLFEPQYKQFQVLFSELEKAAPASNGHVNSEVWTMWKEKLGKGPANVIQVLLDRGKATKQQIVTLTGYSESNVRNNLLPALRKNGLLAQSGGEYSLQQP